MEFYTVVTEVSTQHFSSVVAPFLFLQHVLTDLFTRLSCRAKR